MNEESLINAMERVAADLVNNSTDCPADILKLVDDNFWDLLAE